MLIQFPIDRCSTIQISLKPLRGIGLPKDPELYERRPLSRLFVYPPNNAETAVVHVAGFVVPFLGWRIRQIAEAFPDAIYEDLGGNQIRVEFEINSSNFIDHNHPASGCDYIICWQDDLTEEKRNLLLLENPSLKILELKRFFHDYDVTVTL